MAAGLRRTCRTVRILQAAKTKAQFLVEIAENDDKRLPEEKNVLKDTFAKAKLLAEIEVYPAAHGWCPPDSQVYNGASGRKGVGPFACALQQGSGLNQRTFFPPWRVAVFGSLRSVRQVGWPK